MSRDSRQFLKQGDKAPEFTLPDKEGNLHTLSDHKGEWVLVYFYPKDDTPGCTQEACSIRDTFDEFKKLEARVFGVSVDSVESHEKFARKYDLPFTLLSDSDKTVVKNYGVWEKNEVDGQEQGSTKRTSFLVGPDGNIAKVYEDVDPKSHAEEVIGDIESLTS